MTSARLIYITTPTKEAAEKIANTLLDEKLIACANILPQMNSIYRWQGRIYNDSECVLILKTQEDQVARIKERVPALHEYKCPCLLVLPVMDGYAPYLEWLAEQS